MRIYLDTCSIQRPLDDRTQPRIALEAEAVLVILNLAEAGGLQLLSSEALEFEIRRIPTPMRRQHALRMLAVASERLVVSRVVEARARTLNVAGIKAMDALHLALAIEHGADRFCTTDDRLLKKARTLEVVHTRFVTPVEVVMEVDACT